MQPPRLATSLVLIPLFAFVLAWKTEPLPAYQDPTNSSTGSKKKTAPSRTKGSAASKGTAPAKTTSQGSTKSTARGTTSAKKRTSKGGSKSASKKAPKQQQPEPERIREIQQALKNHGYDVEATGVYDAATVEAVKKFQTDQNIENLSGRGKLDSLTLIALGLGPKREPPSGPGEAPQRSPEGHFP